MLKRCLVLAAFLSACCLPLRAAEHVAYYVDSENGSDDASGTSPELAWQSLEKVNRVDLKPGDAVRFARGGLWRGSLKPKSGSADNPIFYTSYGDNDKPKPRIYGSLPLNKPTDWRQIEPQLWRTVEPVGEPTPSPWLADIGNLILDGKKAAIKRWSKEQLKANDDFWFELETRYVWLVSEKNPAEKYAEIEAAQRRHHVVDLSGVHHAHIFGFDVRYGAAHGFGGSGNSNITICSCDVSWIGGGHQFTRPDGLPVRFGNGIEFWANGHDHWVVGCRLWEIYDAALTNQGDGSNVQRNITYCNNIVWNCEYSFEYWNRDETSVTDMITFQNNTCLNAGRGWGHTQRPDPNGRHLMFYETTAKTTNFVITDNVFANATESILRVDSRRGQEQSAELSNTAQQKGELAVAWARELKMDNNVWFQPPGDGRTLVLWQSKKSMTSANISKKPALTKTLCFNATRNKARKKINGASGFPPVPFLFLWPLVTFRYARNQRDRAKTLLRLAVVFVDFGFRVLGDPVFTLAGLVDHPIKQRRGQEDRA